MFRIGSVHVDNSFSINVTYTYILTRLLGRIGKDTQLFVQSPQQKNIWIAFRGGPLFDVTYGATSENT